MPWRFTHSLRTSSRSSSHLASRCICSSVTSMPSTARKNGRRSAAVVVAGRREHAGNDVRRVLHVDEHLEERRVRHPAHALRDLAASVARGSPSHSGAWIDEPGSEARDAVVVMRDHDVAHALALLGRSRFPFVDVVEDADQLGLHVGALVAEDLFLPLAEVRRADPDRVVDAGVDETLRALVQERVLARPRAEALAEQHDLRPRARPARRGAARRSRRCRSRACLRPSPTRSSDSGDGRAAYCIATVAQFPRDSISSTLTAA